MNLLPMKLRRSSWYEFQQKVLDTRRIQLTLPLKRLLHLATLQVDQYRRQQMAAGNGNES